MSSAKAEVCVYIFISVLVPPDHVFFRELTFLICLAVPTTTLMSSQQRPIQNTESRLWFIIIKPMVYINPQKQFSELADSLNRAADSGLL